MPEKEESYLVDEIEKMIGRMESRQTLLKSLEILYPRQRVDDNPLEALLLFVRGLRQNDFFEYTLFINTIKRGRRQS